MPSPTHDAVISAIYATAAEPQRWSETLALIADYIGATGGMFAYHDFAGSNNFLVIGRLREDLNEVYLKHYTKNPYALALAHLAPQTPTFSNRLVEDARIRRTAFHADILAPQQIDTMVMITHPSLTRRGNAGGFSFTLTRRQAERRDDVAARLARLAPHLARVVDLSLAFRRQIEGARQDVLLDALPGAALLVTGLGRVVQTNKAADVLLAAGDGLTIQSGNGPHLRANARAETSAMAQLLAQAMPGLDAGEEGMLPGALRVTRPSGLPPLLVLITPMPRQTYPFWDAVDNVGRALVQIIDPHAPALGQAELLRTTTDLTAAEARVVTLLGEGLTMPEAAAALGLSPSTVRTHLARCFDKTGVRSQVALARLLASLPVHPRTR